MKLLAWDTSSKTAALAAMEWDPSKAKTEPRSALTLVSEWTLNVDLTHSDRLLWSIHELLQAARWSLEDVDVFGVGVGPGSFTGLRVGVTTARTLAHALGKPVVPVSSLAALARPAALWVSELGEPAVVIATTDACKGELFALWGIASSVKDCVCLADGDLPGLWKRGVEEQVLKPEELMEEIRARTESRNKSPRKWLVVGEGRSRYPESWKALSKKNRLEPPVPFPDLIQGRFVGLLAWEAYQAGIQRKALAIAPRYTRAPDAQLKLQAGLLKKAP